MADETTQQLLGANFNYTPAQINTFMTYVLYVIIGMLILAIIGFFLWKMWQKSQYKLACNLHKEVGNTVITEQQMVRKMYTADGKYCYHYIPMNKKSPVFEDSFNKIIKRPGGLFNLFQPYTYVGFDAYLKDGKIIPMQYNKKFNENETVEVSLTGIDYDMTNFIKMEVDDYYNKKQRVSALMQVLPYIVFLILVLAWIVGMVMYTKHIEKMVEQMMAFGKSTVDIIVKQIGTIQVIPSK